MTQPEQTTSPIVRLATVVANLTKRITTLERRGTRIPVLDDDPPAGDYSNIWLLNDGRLRARNADGVVFEYVPTVNQRPQLPTFASDPAVSTGWRMWLNGSTGAFKARLANDTVKTFSADGAGGSTDGGTGSAGGGTTTVPKPPVVRRYTHQTTFFADDASCYCPVHGVESALYYGRYSSTHGERRLMYGFDATAIRAALTSQAQIIKTELIVTNLHSFANSGITISWGGHNLDALAGTFSQRYGGVWSGKWPKVGGHTWRTIPNWFGTAFRDGLIRGLTVDQPSSSLSYYGLLKSDLALRFTYSNTTP